MYSFFKEETFGLRHQLTFVGKELKIYLPKNYLEKDSVFANKLGNIIETMGLFWFEVEGKMYELSLPLKIQFEYQEAETFKGKLAPDLLSLEYDVFILRTGDAFVKELNHKQDTEDLVNMMLRIIGQGKLPATISYNESITILLNLLESCGLATKMGMSGTGFEILLSEIYRNKHNVSEPFRMLLNKSNSASPYDFKLVRLNRLSGLNSVFGAMTGEDLYQQMANSIVRTREKLPDRESPLERLIKL